MSYLIGIPYCVALVGFLAFGLHRLVVLIRFFAHRPRALAAAASTRTDARVCIQCPVYNEPLVVEELLAHVTAITWAEDRLEIQILDDSTDETTAIIEGWLARHPQRAARCVHVRRRGREGYKAGALMYGVPRSKAEFFAILDADFRPRADFLQRLMPEFADEQVAAVQAPWSFNNRRRNLLTRVQAIFLDAHFLVEQPARARAGLFFNFNGTAGIVRRSALEQVGGWMADTVTEDLDLCYRLQMRGWRMVYVEGYSVPSELPEGIAAFKSQQRRWTKGGIQVFRKHIGALLRARVPLRVKVEGVIHLGTGFIQVFIMLFAVTIVPALLFSEALPRAVMAFLNPLVLLAGTGATVGVYLSSQYFRERQVAHGFLLLLAAPAVMAFGFAMGVSSFFAVVEGMFARGGEFVRTPKGGARIREAVALRASVATGGLRLVTAVELLIGALLGAAAVHFARESESVLVTVNLGLQSAGFLVLALGSVRDCGWRAFVGGVRA